MDPAPSKPEPQAEPEVGRSPLPFTEITADGMHVRVAGRRVHFEYVLLGSVAVFAVIIAAVAITLRLGPEDVERWGYPGLFLIALLRSASVVIPVPGGGITFAGGAVLGSVYGLPAPLLVGLTVAVAESIGEFTGYGAGMGGSRMLEGRRSYERVKQWIRRRAALTIFGMSMLPSPMFDVAGLAAGASRVPIRVFYPAMFSGKLVRGVAVATLGYYSITFIERFL
jgi:membrane protein DedA with SNARE-associated domain